MVLVLFCDFIFTTRHLSQHMRLWYLSHGRPAKTQASLRIRAVSPEPSRFAHIKYGSRQRVRPNIRHLGPTGWLRIRIWRMILQRTIFSWDGSFHVERCLVPCDHLAEGRENYSTCISEPSHEIMVRFVLRKLFLQTRMRSHPVGLYVYFHTPCMRTATGSGETSRMRRLAWAFAGRLCDKYHNLMSWLINAPRAFVCFLSKVGVMVWLWLLIVTLSGLYV